jgi:hypothetical protein
MRTGVPIMKRVFGIALAAAALVVLGGVFASQAAAATSVPVSMTFTEPILLDIRQGCAVFPDGFCGIGQVVPLGHATETIVFGGACGGACDLRTVSLPGGSIVLHEFFSDPTCPGKCQPNPAEPSSGTLTDVIVGGSGAFAGASGTVTGSVSAAALTSMIKLSGTLTLPN